MTKKTTKMSNNLIKSNKYLIISVVLLALIIVTLIINIEKIKNIEVPLTPKIVASVNGEEITEAELDTRYSFFFYSMGYPEGYKGLVSKEDFLNNLIDEKILLQEAKSNKIPINKEEIETGINELLALSDMKRNELESDLIEAGFSMNYLQEYYAKQIMIGKLINQSVIKNVEVKSEEIESFYEENKDNYVAKEGEIRARHILLETEEEANEIYEELSDTSIILQKEKFIELAKEKSTGPSSVNGGDLGFFGRGAMIKEFENVAFGLGVNEIAKPVKTDFGWHVILRDDNKIYLVEIENDIEKILIAQKKEEALSRYIADLKEKSEIKKGTVTALAGAGCYEPYGLKEDTVVFYHTTSCPYCKEMMPIVKELESEGYDFYWADAVTSEAKVVQECYAGVLQGGVPEFICAGTNDYIVGGTSKEKLKKFADNCKS